jgi:hypothetical protein
VTRGFDTIVAQRPLQDLQRQLAVAVAHARRGA